MRVLDSSLTKFIYPFLFDAKSYADCAFAISNARRSTSRREHNVWIESSFTETDLLPHVATPLGPLLENDPKVRVWNSNQALRDSFAFSVRRDWEMISPNGVVPFKFGCPNKSSLEAQLILFQVGVGFLVIDACPTGESLEVWLDFLHWFRFARRQRGVEIRGTRPTKRAGLSLPLSVEADEKEQAVDTGLALGDFIDSLLQTGNSNPIEKQWWREVYVPGKLLPFSGLFIDEISHEEIPPTLCRIRHFFHSKQYSHPSDSELDLSHEALFPYASQQWFLFALEGTTFVACDPPDTPFFRETLPAHLSSSYYLVYIMALHQRFALIGLSENLSKHWTQGQKPKATVANEALLAAIRGTLNSFTAWGYFTQMMQQQHHHDYYQQWQRWLQIDKLYREVSDQVREIYEFSVMIRTRRLEERISLLGIMTGIPALLLFFLGLNLNGVTVEKGGLALLSALMLVGAGIAVASIALWLLRK